MPDIRIEVRLDPDDDSRDSYWRFTGVTNAGINAMEEEAFYGPVAVADSRRFALATALFRRGLTILWKMERD